MTGCSARAGLSTGSLLTMDRFAISPMVGSFLEKVKNDLLAAEVSLLPVESNAEHSHTKSGVGPPFPYLIQQKLVQIVVT